MIDIRELRCGNIVRCSVSNDAGKYRVLSLNGYLNEIQLDGVRQGEWHKENKVLPLVLTEELLIELGFIEANDDIYGGWLFKFSLRDYIRIRKDNQKFYYNSPFSEHVYIKSVHQLQNLIFALTGRELILNGENLQIS